MLSRIQACAVWQAQLHIMNDTPKFALRSTPSEPGYAQATVAGQLVSYHRYSLNGFAFDHPMPDGMHHSDIMEALILEVARGRGRATAQTFAATASPG